MYLWTEHLFVDEKTPCSRIFLFIATSSQGYENKITTNIEYKEYTLHPLHK